MGSLRMVAAAERMKTLRAGMSPLQRAWRAARRFTAGVSGMVRSVGRFRRA